MDGIVKLLTFASNEWWGNNRLFASILALLSTYPTFFKMLKRQNTT
jgi:hypothetical protein